MESDIDIIKIKCGNQVGRIGPVAHAEGHPDVIDFFTDIWNDVQNALTSQAFLSILGGVAAFVLPVSRVLVAYQQAKAMVGQTNDVLNDIFNQSNRSCTASAEVTLDEADEFDEIRVRYHAYSEDEITCVRHATEALWSKIGLDPGPIQQVIEEDDESFWYQVTIQTSTLEDGLYPFVFGAVDSGHFRVAAFSYLTLTWRKKPKPTSTSLRQLSEGIDPSASSRTLREVSDILDIAPASLRRCCEEQARCRSIQALEPSFRIFEQNVALLPDHLGELDILGVKHVPLFALYKGSNRQAAIESFIAYLKAERPDIAGFCEFWNPEERRYLRSCLSEIYPLDDAFGAEGPIGGAPGLCTLMDGGLLLLSKWPIMARDQMIYTACQNEDCFSAKGALHAGICVPGYPSLIHVFLTHLQSCPTATSLPARLDPLPREGCGPGEDCWEKLKVFQVGELREFIRVKAGQRPCIVMGDFNLNAFDDGEYAGLVDRLGNPNDVWQMVTDHGLQAFWPGTKHEYKWDESDVWHSHQQDPITKGMTQSGTRAFEPSDPACIWNAEVRQQDGRRIDYIFNSPKSTSSGGYLLSFARSRVVMILLNDSQDASDHYGLCAELKSIRALK